VFKEYGSNGEPLAQYYTADGQTVARQMFGNHARKEDGYQGNIRTRGGLMYYQYDGLGNVMDVTDRLGSQVMGYRYDAFGNLFTQMAAPYNAVGYTGKTYDAKASLMDYSARWYSPSVGRFTTPDTYEGNLSVPGTLNRYAYVGNNPVNYVDPTGHDSVSIGVSATNVTVGQSVTVSASSSYYVAPYRALYIHYATDSGTSDQFEGPLGSSSMGALFTLNHVGSITVWAALMLVDGSFVGSNHVTITWSDPSTGGGGTSGGDTGGSGDTGGGSGGPPTIQEIIAMRSAAYNSTTGSKPSTSYRSARSATNQKLIQENQRHGSTRNVGYAESRKGPYTILDKQRGETPNFGEVNTGLLFYDPYQDSLPTREPNGGLSQTDVNRFVVRFGGTPDEIIAHNGDYGSWALAAGGGVVATGLAVTSEIWGPTLLTLGVTNSKRIASLLKNVWKTAGKGTGKLPTQGRVSEIPDAPPVNAGKQGNHVPGHPNNIPTKSQWPADENGVGLTQQAWQKGTPVKPDGSVKTWDAGGPIGPNGETRVKVHINSNGEIHGYPVR
jgi:RHS repeat-associated protein